MKNTFPDNFLWGASTSAYQVEGGNFNCDWHDWEIESDHEKCGGSCHHYDLYEEDIAIAKDLGHNAHRLGLEWSRLEPVEGKFNEKEWDHYKQVLDTFIANGIEPILTLHHFTLPLWLSQKGGWLNANSPLFFKRFAEKASIEIGDRIKYWITINEPNILAILSYYWGQWPPCHRDFHEAIIVLKNMLRAHALAYAPIKRSSKIKTMVGVAKAVTAFHSFSNVSLFDRFSTHSRNIFHNHAFISSLINGRTELKIFAKENLPNRNTLDFIGLNYYFRQFIKGGKNILNDRFGEVVSPPSRSGNRETTDMGWEIYPEGLYEVSRSFSKYHLPIIITENGIATTNDKKREKYLRDHLQSLLKAINEGIPVKGYLHWSLLDNFEWDSGYSKKFGLVEVDFNTMERKIRPSAEYYSKVIRSGRIDQKPY